MNEQVNVAVNISGNGADVQKNVKSIRQELREAQQDAVNLARKFGELSPEALQAAQRVANLRDEFGDLKQRIDALNPDAKFKAFSQSLQGVAGGFAGLQGAIGLFGTESAELEKQLLKVQSALALSQGLDSLLEARDSFKTLGAVIRGNVTKAFSTLRGAIIATGIGALVVGVGLLIANFETVKKVILNAVPGLAKVGEVIGKIVQKVTDFVGITSEAERASDRLTKASKTRNEELDRQIKLLQAQGGKESEIAKLQKEKANNDLKALEAQKKANKIANDEFIKQQKDLNNEKAVIDAAEKKRLDDIAEADRKKREEEAKQKKKERDAEIEAERKRRQDEISKAGEQARDAFEAGQKELREANKEAALENRLSTFTESQREIEELTIAYNEKLQKAKEFGVDIAAVTEEYNRNVSDIQKKQDVADLEAQIAKDQANIAKVENDFANDLAILDAQRISIINNTALTEEQRTKLLDENSKARRAIEDAEFQAKQEKLAAYVGLINGLADVVGKQTIAGKALAIAGATIDTYSAANKALDADYGIFGPAAQIARFLAVTTTIARGIKNVKAIASVKVPTGGSGSGSAPSISSGGISATPTPTQAPIAQAVQVQQTALTPGGNQVDVQNQSTVKAFVVEKDITDSQDRISKIKAAATI